MVRRFALTYVNVARSEEFFVCGTCKYDSRRGFLYSTGVSYHWEGRKVKKMGGNVLKYVRSSENNKCRSSNDK